MRGSTRRTAERLGLVEKQSAAVVWGFLHGALSPKPLGSKLKHALATSAADSAVQAPAWALPVMAAGGGPEAHALAQAANFTTGAVLGSAGTVAGHAARKMPAAAPVVNATADLAAAKDAKLFRLTQLGNSRRTGRLLRQWDAEDAAKAAGGS